ncbi:hypothetical protein Tco_0269058 [Tanacetum coccineum]
MTNCVGSLTRRWSNPTKEGGYASALTKFSACLKWLIPNNALSSAFKTFFERETLTGPNFNEWHRSLRIVLRVADTYEYLYKPCPDQPPETATAEEKAAWKAEYKKHSMWLVIMHGKKCHLASAKDSPLTRISSDFVEETSYALVGKTGFNAERNCLGNQYLNMGMEHKHLLNEALGTFKDYLSENGIDQNLNFSHLLSQLNGVSERRYRTISRYGTIYVYILTYSTVYPFGILCLRICCAYSLYGAPLEVD